ncbi:hypothetical protein YC2023_116263 [Brassica napus]
MNENGRCKLRVSNIYIRVLRVIGSGIGYNQSASHLFFFSLSSSPLSIATYDVADVTAATYSLMVYLQDSLKSFQNSNSTNPPQGTMVSEPSRLRTRVPSEVCGHLVAQSRDLSCLQS